MKPASVKSRILGRLVSVLLVPVILSSSVTTVYVSADDEVDVVEIDAVLDAQVDEQIDDTQDTTIEDVNDDSDDSAVNDVVAGEDEVVADASSDVVTETTSDDGAIEITEDADDQDGTEPLESDLVVDPEDLDSDAHILDQKSTAVLRAYRTLEEKVNVNLSISLVDSSDRDAIKVFADGNRLDESNQVKVQFEYKTVQNEDGSTVEEISKRYIELSHELKDYYQINSVCWNGESCSIDSIGRLEVQENSVNTLAIEVESTDKTEPVIGDVSAPSEGYFLGVYYSASSDSLKFSTAISDDNSGIAEVKIYTSNGSYDMSGDGTYSWTPSENGFNTIYGIYAKDKFGRYTYKQLQNSVTICFYGAEDGDGLTVSLSDNNWHSTDVNEALILTAEVTTYREVDNVEIDGEAVYGTSSNVGWGKKKFTAKKTLPTTQGQNTYTVTKINFKNGDSLALEGKSVTAKIDNTKPAGTITAKADVSVASPESLAEWLIAIYNKVILGTEKVNVIYNIPASVEGDNAYASGIRCLEYIVVDGGERSLTAEQDSNGDFVAKDTFYHKSGKELTYEIVDGSVYLKDIAGNKSDQNAVTIDADFDLIVFDGAGPNIEYSYGQDIFSEPEGDKVVRYFDAPINGTVKINDINLGSKAPVIKDYDGYSKVNVDTQNYTTDNSARRDIRTYSFTASNEGEYFFNTKMSDQEGHVKDEDSDILRVDLTAPSVDVKLISDDETISAEGSGKKYFNKAVTVVATMTEKWPLLGSCQVTVTRENVDGTEVSSITEYFADSDTDVHVLSIPDLQDGTYTLSVKAIDKAGNPFGGSPEGVSNYVTFVVDQEAPIVELTFDTAEAKNGKYYNVPRTATITITEYTFAEDRVQLELSEEYGSAEQSGWSSPSRNVYVKTIKFEKDGIYSLRVKCTDMAKNESEVKEEKEFYIDRTAPEISVAYNNNDAKNGMYYKNSRTAFVKVDDLSFDAGLIEANSQSIDGLDSLPSLGGFEGSGKEHTGYMYFENDGMYGYTIKCEDLAGNVFSGYTSDVFVIDTKAPEVQFGGVENFSANNGTVAPSVSYVDKYMDMEATTVTMTGSNNGAVAVGSQVAPAENGFVVSYADFEHVKSMDDLYVLEANVVDLAGNETKEQLVFSVNRFGSVFVLSDAAKVLNEEYYTSNPTDVAITEINVDELTYRNVSISRDGDIKELKNGKQYKVTKQGSDTTWKTYTYTISKDNFEKDGIYSVTVYSKDRATNVQDNKSRDAEINFAVDRTAPSIVTAGLEEAGEYKETSHVVNIDVTDNMGVTSLTVYKDDQEIESYDAEALESAGGVESITLDESEKRQTIKLVAEDVAGNVETVAYGNILVSTKEEVAPPVTEEVANGEGDLPEIRGATRPLNVAVYIVLALGIVAAGAGAGVLVYRKKVTSTDK